MLRISFGDLSRCQEIQSKCEFNVEISGNFRIKDTFKSWMDLVVNIDSS
jgi:hypothetical protein